MLFFHRCPLIQQMDEHSLKRFFGYQRESNNTMSTSGRNNKYIFYTAAIIYALQCQVILLLGSIEQEESPRWKYLMLMAWIAIISQHSHLSNEFNNNCKTFKKNAKLHFYILFNLAFLFSFSETGNSNETF